MFSSCFCVSLYNYFFAFFLVLLCSFSFFFNDTATTEIYTLSLHDALPIFAVELLLECHLAHVGMDEVHGEDRKSTRLNSSHANISYAVFCLKKKNITNNTVPTKEKTKIYIHFPSLKKSG